jgi:hypothetical protein
MGYQVCDNIGNIQCPGGIGNGGEPILELNPETPDILEPGFIMLHWRDLWPDS